VFFGSVATGSGKINAEIGAFAWVESRRLGLWPRGSRRAALPRSSPWGF